MPEKRQPEVTRLITTIKNNGASLATKKLTAGFDGFIDTIVRVIRSKHGETETIYFNSIKEFGDYILTKQAASFSLETELISQKPGGNMPIMANALSCLGIPVNCIGALGYPEIHPVFKIFPSVCRMYSFADPGTSTAFEFNDGKMMMADMGSLNQARWDKISNLVGIDTLVGLYKESDMLCLLNWSEIDASTDIWKGLLREVFPQASGGWRVASREWRVASGKRQKQIVFIDLSDCSKRSVQSITEALTLTREFGKYADLILSLNKNEARLIYTALYNEAPGNDPEETGKKIFEKLEPETLLLHSSKEALAFTKQGTASCKSFFIQSPLVSTGAGDNFNAGFAAARLLGLEPHDSLLFAHATAALYINSGSSPALPDIIEFLECNTNQPIN